MLSVLVAAGVCVCVCVEGGGSILPELAYLNRWDNITGLVPIVEGKMERCIILYFKKQRSS